MTEDNNIIQESGDQPDQIPSIQPNVNIKKNLAVILLVFLAAIVVLWQLNNTYDTENVPSPVRQKVKDNSFCEHKLYVHTFSEALKSPADVCTLKITKDNDVDGLASISSKLVNLQSLVIQNTQKTKLPPEIGLLRSLTTLTLFETDQLYIPKEIGNLTEITKLSIIGSDLEMLPPEIGDLRNITKLSLRNNEDLVVLPKSFVKLTKLKSLALWQNNQLQVSNSLFNHPNLEEFIIEDNSLENIPVQTYQLTHLKKVNFAKNKIKYVSPDIKNLKLLQILILTNNMIPDFPDVSDLSNLEELDLSNNQLIKLPPGIANLPKLSILRVSHNDIDDSTTDALQHVQNLVSLDLSNNKMTKLPQGLENLKKLQHLNLSGNKIDKKQISTLQKSLPTTNIVY